MACSFSKPRMASSSIRSFASYRPDISIEHIETIYRRDRIVNQRPARWLRLESRAGLRRFRGRVPPAPGARPGDHDQEGADHTEGAARRPEWRGRPHDEEGS